MAAHLEFGLLGPLVVRCEGVVVHIAGGRQQALLAALLLNAGHLVSADQLTDVLWDQAPPSSARACLHNQVRRLRAALGEAGRDRVCTQPGGYLIRVQPGELDVARMRELLASARAAIGRGAWDQASAIAAGAVLLWRGEPLAGVDSAVLARAIPAITEVYLQAVETRLEAEVQLGRQAEVVSDLRRLTADHPFREHAHALLMLALYRCGRQGEALAAYRAARQVLVAELGCEPGPELQQVLQQILSADPSLSASQVALPAPAAPAAGSPVAAAPAPATAAARPSPVVPRQLPAPVSHFTGRAAELDALSSTLNEASGSRTVVISALAGTAGVGKTAVAVHWAHQVADRFTDGQLYVNLQGYDPDEPVLAADALAGFLRALGVAGLQIPDDMEERARLYRSRLAGRRVLVLLDNARDGNQVRPLLPGEPGCLVVVTSRDALAGLVATDGAVRLDLNVLPLADAIGLLRSLIGPRADEDPGALADLARLCARLPLALRIAAELAAARPAAPLAELAAELETARLDGLDAGEDRADVRAVFSWSFRQLPGELAGAFALLGHHPGEDLDVHAAAALTGSTAEQARRVLGRLHRASLVQAAGTGRYGMHDLLRAYARQQALARDTAGQRNQALTRLFDYYLAATTAAADALYPAEARYRPRIAATSAVVPAMSGQAGARAWLDTERANLVAVVVHCADHGQTEHAFDLAATLFRYLMAGSHLPEAHKIFSHVLDAARQSGDSAAEAAALNGLGGIGIIKGHFHEAAGLCRAALRRYRQCGDRAGQAGVLQNLGVIESKLHDPQSAAGFYRQAIAAYEDAGDKVGAARALADLALPETELGSHDAAAEHLRRALPVLRDATDELWEARALARMGDLDRRRSQPAQAADCYAQALAMYRRIDYRTGIAAELGNLGEVNLCQGAYHQAISYFQQALTLHRQTGNQHGETLQLRNLAEALRETGQPAAARAELETALRLAAETGNTYQQACVHRDLAESHHSADQREQARHHWQQALDLYNQLGAPEADQVRSRLSAQKATAQR